MGMSNIVWRASTKIRSNLIAGCHCMTTIISSHIETFLSMVHKH